MFVHKERDAAAIIAANREHDKAARQAVEGQKGRQDNMVCACGFVVCVCVCVCVFRKCNPLWL